MAGKKAKMFRSQMGGFNKDDVNNYIKETDLKHAEEIDGLKSTIESIKADVASLTERCASLESANARLVSEKAEIDALLTEKDAQIADIAKKLDFYKSEAEAQINVMNNLKTENKRLASELEAAANNNTSSLDEEIARLTSLNNEKDTIIVSLNDELERVNAENIALSESVKANESKADMGDVNDRTSDAYKLDMYNKISSQLGDILINANRNADDIVSAAKADAERMIADTQVECDKKLEESTAEAKHTRERIAEISENIIASVSGDLHGNIENCMKEITTCIDDMQYEIKTLMTKLQSRSSEMNEKVAYYQNTASEGLDNKLGQMDSEYSAILSRGDEENV